MVDPLELAGDIGGTVAFFLGPGLLWLFLYLWAWEDAPAARAAGFDRRVFWILLPAALIGSFANAPFFGWDGSIVAMNIGGALLPLALSLLLPSRALGPDRGPRTIGMALGALALLTALLFAAVVASGGPLRFEASRVIGGHGVGAVASLLLAGPIATVPLMAVAALLAALTLVPERPEDRGAGRDPDVARPVRGMLILSVVALVLTYLSTAAVPGVGIVSAFPEYLAAPCLVGFLAVAFSRRAFGVPPAVGIAFGYACATLGVLVGADVLRQPPLYGTGAAGFLSIGGAGLLDLVYLSGLFAAAVGALTYYIGRRAGRFVPAPPVADPPAPARVWRGALVERERGSLDRALVEGLRAVELARDRARHLAGVGPAPAEDPWRDLGVAPWVTTDHLNLRALAARPAREPWETERGIAAAQQLLGVARHVELRPLAGVLERCGAFLIDLLLVTAPAVAVWILLASSLPGNLPGVLASVIFAGAIFGYAAFAFAYFLASEAWTGTTVGKRILGLEVRTRELERPGPLALLLRNVPRLIPLTILSQFMAVGILLLVRSGAIASVGGFITGGALAGFIVISLALGGALFSGLLTAGIMRLSPEHARFGDLWAGTWVIRSAAVRASSGAPPPGAVGAPAPPSG